MKFLKEIFVNSTLCLKHIKKISIKTKNINTNYISENFMKRTHDMLFSKITPFLRDNKIILTNNNEINLLSLKNSKDKYSNIHSIKPINPNLFNLSKMSLLEMSELMRIMNYTYINQRDIYLNIARDVFRNIESNWKILNPTKENILHLTFFILAFKPKMPSLTLMKCIEEFVNLNIKQFSYSDLSIISLCFFATNTKYSNHKTAMNISAQFSYTFKLLEDERKNSPLLLYDVSNMLKSMRHMQYNNINFYEDIGDMMCNILRIQSEHQMSPTYLSQICSIIFSFSSLQIYHENLIQMVTSIIEANDHRIRLKDYARLLWSMSYFRCPLNSKLLERFSRFLDMDLNEGIVKLHLMVFIECLVGFCLHQHFHQRGILALFSHEILNIYKRNKLEENDQTLFLQTYLCLQNNENIVNQKINVVFNKLEFEIKTRQGFLTLLKGLYTVFESDITKFKFTYILPFSKIPDIELRVNSENKLVSFNKDSNNSLLKDIIKNFKNKDDMNGSISNIELLMKESDIDQRIDYEQIHLKPMFIQTDIRRICIKIFGQNQYLLNNRKVDGYHFYQLRMLQDLMYEVYIIDPIIAKKLDYSTENLKIIQYILNELKIII